MKGIISGMLTSANPDHFYRKIMLCDVHVDHCISLTTRMCTGEFQFLNINFILFV